MYSQKTYANHWHTWVSKNFPNFRRFTFNAEVAILSQATRHLLKHITSNPVTILEVGPGDGVMTQEFLNLLSAKKQNFTYTGIDISTDLMCMFVQNTRKVEKTLSLYYADANSVVLPTPVNLIFSFHSWYGIQLERIPYFISRLCPGGILAIVIGSSQCISNDITQQFTDEHVLSGEDLAIWLQDHCLTFQQYDIHSSLLTKDLYLTNTDTSEASLRYLTRRPRGTLHDVKVFLKKQKDDYFLTKVKLFILTTPKLCV